MKQIGGTLLMTRTSTATWDSVGAVWLSGDTVSLLD